MDIQTLDVRYTMADGTRVVIGTVTVLITTDDTYTIIPPDIARRFRDDEPEDP